MAYGYVGDTSSDTGSLKGQGSFPHSSKPGSLIDGYSAALKTSDAKAMGVTPGQEFKDPATGKTVRYDDTIPEWSKSKPGYVDIYTPHAPPDPGVSQAHINNDMLSFTQNPVYGKGAQAPNAIGSIGKSAAPPVDMGAFIKSHPYLSNVPNIQVASQDDVKMYDNYINNGGDGTKLGAYEQLGVALAKDPNFLTKPENWKVFQEFVQKPQEQAYDPLKSAEEAFGAVGPGLVQAGQDAGNFLLNGVKLAGNAALYQIQKSTGWGGGVSGLGQPGTPLTDGSDIVTGGPQAPQAPVQGSTPMAPPPTPDNPTQAATGSRFAQAAANFSGTVGQAGADITNMIEGTAMGTMGLLGRPIVAALPLSPQARQDVEDSRSQALQSYARDQVSMAQWATGSQQAAAGVFKSLYGASQIADKLATDTPDPSVMRGGSALAQFAAPELAGEMAAVRTAAVRPTFFEQGLYKTEAAAQATGEATGAKIATIVPTVGTDAEKALATQTVGDGAGVARAAQDAATASHNDLMSTGQAMQKMMGQPLSAASVVGKLMQKAGDAAGTLSNVGNWIENAPEALSQKLTGGNPVFQPVVKAAISKAIDYGAFEHMGVLGKMGADLGSAVFREALPMAQDFLTSAGKELTYGVTSTPYWQRVAEQTSGMARNLAMALDKPQVYAAGQAASASVKGGVAGAAVGGLMGMGQNPYDPVGGAVQGMAAGGIFGMAGGGFGQWRNIDSPTQLTQEARGDWNRYRDLLNTDDKKSFDSLTPQNQTAVSSISQHFPGLRIEYYNSPEGVAGSHSINADGSSIVRLNTAQGNQSLAPLLAHEFGHEAAHNGVLPNIYDSLLGNPATGKIGQYTDLDSTGKPVGVDPQTGRYTTNNDFANLKNQYISKVAGSKDANGAPIPTDHLNDLNIAREIYSEHAANYWTSGEGLAASKAYDPNFTGTAGAKDALAKLGAGFTNNGEVVKGSGLFDSLKRNDELDGYLKNYYQHRSKRDLSRNPEEIPDTKFTDKDLRNPNVAATSLDSAPQFQRDKNGVVMREPNGKPIMNTSGEVNKIATNMAQAADAKVSSLPDDVKNSIGFKQTGKDSWFSRYLPDDAVDSMLAHNQNNTTQSTNFRLINKNLADASQVGKEYNFFYHKATMNGRYGSFAGLSRDMVPYGVEKTGTNNINFKSVDFAQLTNNFLRNRNKPGIKGLWDTAQSFVNDADIYFKNHANGDPGETNLGADKKNAINALGKFGTDAHKAINPLTDRLAGNPIIKSFRLDRINRVTPLDNLRPFTDVSQYDKMTTNFRPAEDHPEAISPKAPVGFDLTKSPLLGPKGQMIDKITNATRGIPQAIPQQTLDTDFRYLNKTEQNKLQVLQSNGAVKKYGDRVADDIFKQRDVPQVAQFSKALGQMTPEAKDAMSPDIQKWNPRYMRRMGYEGQTDGQPWRILPKDEAGVSNLDYSFSQLATNHAAKKLGMEPEDVKAVTAFTEKHHWEERGWIEPKSGADKQDSTHLSQ